MEADDVGEHAVAEGVLPCSRPNRVEDGSTHEPERECGERDPVGRVVPSGRLDQGQVPVRDQVLLVEPGVAPSCGLSPGQVQGLLHEVLVVHAGTDDGLLDRGQDAQEQPP